MFDWPLPVRFSADVIGGQFVVQFDRPVTGDVQTAAANLSGYLREGRISPDRRAVSFPLTNAFQMRALTVGTAVVIDLYGLPPVRPQPVVPQPVAAPPATVLSTGDQVTATVPVTVRNGRHPDYLRVVFDWPEQVSYTVDRQGDRALITFQRPSSLSIDALRRGLPVELRAASLTTGNNETVVNLPAPSDQEIRHFVNGNSIVVDLVSAGGIVAANADPAAPAAPAPGTRPTPITPDADQVAQAPTPQSAIRPTGTVPAELMAELRIPVPSAMSGKKSAKKPGTAWPAFSSSTGLFLKRCRSSASCGTTRLKSKTPAPFVPCAGRRI